MNSDLPFYLGFSAFPGIGPLRFKLLLEYFGSAKAAWHASKKELENVGLSKTLVGAFVSFRNTFNSASYMEKMAYQHVNMLIQTDAQYPKLLKAIPDPPIVLFVKSGRQTRPIAMDRTIAVVGTRHATPYGREVTRRITRELVDFGCVIVSGMAYGIDAEAHMAAIEADGKTIAVLGCGVDIIAPPVNAPIYKKLAIEHFGAVVSEMPLGLRPNKGMFPARNRIISGLSLGVLVTEGTDHSGSLITARNALEQGRDVFTVPGPITSIYSKAPMLLLKNGAVPVDSASDIIEALHIPKKPNEPHHTSCKEKKGNRTKHEEKILRLLSCRPYHINDIVRECSLTVAQVSSILSILEMEGEVKDIGGKVYGSV